METVRSFIAVELPDEVRKEIVKLQDSLKIGRQEFVKWVSPDSIHITLKFLGDIATDKVDEVITAVEDSVTGMPPFTLHLGGLGVFPGLKKIQVVWVGLTGDIDNLRRIQKNIEENLFVLGYPEEEREFTPHLTLGRVRFQPPPEEQQKFVHLLTAAVFSSTHNINVASVNLMKSQLTPKGAIYTNLGSVNLKHIV
jgi:2'-5' RNA ligase